MTTSTTVERRRLRARRALLRVTTILCTSLAPAIVARPATAQVAAPAPARQSLDANGVDLFLGTMNVDGPVLSAGGEGLQGLSWRKFNHGAGWGDNQVATLSIGGSTAYVAFGTATDSFSVSGSTFTSIEGSGATLTLSGTVYTYTTANGTIAHFDKIYVGSYPYGSVGAIIADVTRPNGETLTYTYTSAPYCSASKPGGGGQICTKHSTAYRISSVTNNSQYRLIYNYAADELGSDPDTVPFTAEFQAWGDNIGVSMTNSAISGASVRSQTFTRSTSGGSSYLTITDPMSRATVYRFTSTGAGVAGIKLPGSSSEDVTVTYSAGKVASVTNPIGTTGYAYADASGVRTVTVTDPASKVTTYTFDIASQRMTAMTDATGKTTNWQYDSSGRVTRVTMPEGNYVQSTYDARGNATETRTVAKSGSGMSDLVSTASYDASCSNTATCNKPNSTTDERGNTTDFTYDTAGNLLTVTAPAPTSGATRPKTTYTYTAVNGGSVLNSTSVCRTTASCAGTSDETKTVLTYNANGLPATITKGSGDNALTSTLAMTYDDVGNVTSVDGPLSGSDDIVTYRYDADRERIGAIAPDPDGSGPKVRAAARTTYNAKGQVTQTDIGTVADASDSAWSSFNTAQYTISVLDGAGRTVRSVLVGGSTTYGVTDYSFDSAGRPDCVTLRMNPSTWGTATPACTAQTAGSNGPDRIVRTTYDDAGRPLTKISAYGISGTQSTEATLTYTSNGKIATATDAEGNKTTYEYDGVDRLAKTRYPTATTGAGSSSTTDYEQLTYDAGSNVTNWRLRDGSSIGFAYDALNRVTVKDLPGSEPDLSYGYDLLGQSVSVTRGDGHYVNTGYDALGRVTSASTVLGGTVGYQYDVAGRRTRLTWDDGFYVTYDYDTAGKMTAVRENGAASGAGVLATYAYDDLGRRTTITRGNGVTTSYGYDSVSRLTALGLDLAGSSDDISLGFSFNPAGQIAGATRSNDGYAWTGAATASKSYTANGLNQYSAASGASLTYDAKGNLTNLGSLGFAYNSENLLTSGSGGGGMLYDPLGRALQSASSGTITARFAYDGSDLISEYNGSNVLQRRYVFGAGTDEPLVWYEGSGTSDRRWLIADERGSIVAVTNTSGAPLAINTYDEYGTPGSANLGRFQYTGQVWVPELGMYNFKARMYSPALGRFMQTDPIGYADGMNWHNYVAGDPVNGTDPTGLKKKDPPKVTPGSTNSDGTINWTSDDGRSGTYDPRTGAVTIDITVNGLRGSMTNSPQTGMQIDVFGAPRAIDWASAQIAFDFRPERGGGDGTKPTPKTPPPGFHFPAIDPKGKVYMVRNGDKTEKLEFTPWWADRAAANKLAMEKSMGWHGLGATGIGFVPGAGPFAGFVGAVLGVLGLGSSYSEVPKSPAK